MSTKRGLVPVTALLRFDDVNRGLGARRVVGHLGLHSMGDSSTVPVEVATPPSSSRA
ncbi:MAG: hypothetical protein IPK07_31530 [Deltaproteobacteria bacterium]|nr:hypothetical protein [Deltaproteobacteria bacterium]